MARRREPRTPHLDALDGDEAKNVLRQLLRAHPELVADAEELAERELDNVDVESVGHDLRYVLSLVDLQELYATSGPQPGGGYVDPSEGCWQVLEDNVEPYIDHLLRLVGAGREDTAADVVRGVVLGLYAFENDEPGETVEHVPDFGVETAGVVISRWRSAPGSKAAKAARRLGRDLTDRIPRWAHRFE